jgi:ATP-binding cassette subfamily C (CFTR/MRP) protein 1
MLQGIKVTKLNNYEQSYEDRITAIREKELHYLKTEMAIWATTLLMTVSSPVLATGACFATYVLLDPGNNILTAADTFGVLLLFNALRFPINFAGRLIGKAAQALSAVRRVALFLERPLRSDNDEHIDQRQKQNDIQIPTESTAGNLIEDDDDIPLVLEGARFRIGGGDGGDADTSDGGNEECATLDPEKDTSTNNSVSMDLSNRGENSTFTVSEFTLKLPKGHVLAVCGPVGSGKSSFLNGILDETEVLDGSKVIKRGQFSYAPQDPFILNQSLRENILFGLPYDEVRYSKVLDACALRPDIEQLGGSDMVQIGERGVTLSGGQRQVSKSNTFTVKKDII